jgi:hypothetical protein
LDSLLVKDIIIIIKRYPMKALGPAPVVNVYTLLTSTEATLYSNNAAAASNDSQRKNNMSTKGLDSMSTQTFS